GCARGQGLATKLLPSRAMSGFGRDRLERPVVAGFGAPPVGRHPGRSPTDLALDALDEALERSGMDHSAVEGVYSVPEGYARAQAPIHPHRVAQRRAHRLRPLARVASG